VSISQSVSRQQFLCYEGEGESERDRQDYRESEGEIDDGKNRIVG
jgi:hypothetical protein